MQWKTQNLNLHQNNFLKKLQKKNVYFEFKKKLIDDAWKVDNNDHSPDSEEFEEDEESLFESGLDNNVDINENKRIRVIMYNHINRISTNFKNYCSQTPVLGFNSIQVNMISILLKIS